MFRIRIMTLLASVAIALSPFVVNLSALRAADGPVISDSGGISLLGQNQEGPGTRVKETPDFTGTFVANGQNIGTWQRFPTHQNRFGFFTRVWSRSSVYILVPTSMVRLSDGKDYLFMTYIRYSYNAADPTNVDYWRQEMSGRIFVDPATNAGSWAVDDTYEAFGSRQHLDNPQFFSMAFIFNR